MTDRPQILRAAAIGTAAGLAGAWAMELWQGGASDLRAAAAKAKGETPEESEPATEKAADAVSRAVRGRPVSQDGKSAAGRAVHYATGAALGAVYAVTVELWEEGAAGFGAGLALASWAGLDEAVTPVLGFGAPPQETSPGDHAYGLAAHLIFGVATEGVRRVLRGRD